MKSFKSTLIFSVLVLIVGTFAYWDFRKSELEDKNKLEESQLLPDWVPEELTKVKFENSSRSLNIEKIEDRWQIKTPVSDEADEASFISFMASILSDDIIKLDIEGEPNWANYGFGEVSRFLEVERQDGTRKKIIISNKKSFDGKYYLRFEDRGELYLGSSSWEGWLNRDVNDLRNKRLFSSLPSITEVSIVDSKLKKNIKFKNEKETWSLVEPVSNLIIDSKKILDVVNSVYGFRAMEVVSESRSEDVLKKFKLIPSLKVVKIKFGSEMERTLNIGQVDTKSSEVFLYLEEKPFVYKSNPSMFSSWSVEPKDYEEKSKDQPKNESIPTKDSNSGTKPLKNPTIHDDHKDHNH